MAETPKVTPEYFQILVMRELRKAGFDIGDVRIHRRSELPEPQRGFVLELTAPVSHATWHKRALVACRSQNDPVSRDAVDDLRSRLPGARAEVGILFATAVFCGETGAAAQQSGRGLLRGVGGGEAYDGGRCGTPGQYPARPPAPTAG